jgi:PDZ domain
MRISAFLLCLVFAASAVRGEAAVPRDLPATVDPVSSSSLVRVNSTNQAFDFFRPWTKKAPYLRRGLGVVLQDGQILVTAELVANRTYVELEKPGSAEKSPAEVAVVDYDCNLALLRPSNSTFLKDAKPLLLDSGASVGDRASILQLESNGQIADTPGVITTITVAGYPLDHLALLTYRISAPLQNREGSFTIPAIRDGKLLGLLMRYDPRSQTADVVSAPVISHFLKDAKLQTYPGFPRAGLVFASTRDPQFRRYIGLNQDGVYITEIRPGSAAEKAGLRKGDVILAVAGKSLDQDGNYEEPGIGRIPFSHITNTLTHVGETVNFSILRDGKRESVPVTLTSVRDEHNISEAYEFDHQPRYLIVGGLVFRELSRPYLQEWGGNWMKDAPQRLVYLDAFQNELPPDRGKIVFLSQVFPTPNTLGYENLEHLVVTKVNGTPIKSLDDLAKATTALNDGFLKIEFDEDPSFIYLDASDNEKSKKQLMQDYGIPALENLEPIVK